MLPDDLQKEDYKFVVTSPDPDFSPERNKHVIDSTIKKYETERRRKLKLARDGIIERADALADWARSPKGWGAGNPVSRYFSKRMIAYLRGDELRKQVMSNVIGRNTDKLYKKLAKKN